jgi:asparagine synthase (glutamine-hydrolysing)
VEINGGIAFASELKALLAADLIEREVDLEAIHRFLTYGYVPAPDTGFRRIRKLPPGHRLIWENGKTRIERYWTIDFRPKRILEIGEWKTAVRDTVRKAVVDRMISDVPLGAFLSGGIDSTIVVACMAEASDRPIETFSIGFEHEAFNELPYARQVAERYATSHHEFMVRADDASLLPRLARLYEEPYADSSALPSYFLARETRRHVTVALSGDGGDEGFAGYGRYGRICAVHPRSAWLRATGVRALLGLAYRAGGLLPPAITRQLEVARGLTGPDLAESYAWTIRLFSDGEKRALYGEQMREALSRPCSSLLAHFTDDPRAGTALIDRLCFTDVMTYLPDDILVKMDLAAMVHGLETRPPLLDHRVLELAASAPAEVRFRGGQLKWLLKEAFREAFPPGLLERRKTGFGIPLQEWFRGPLLPVARELLLARDSRIHAYLRRDALATALEHHAAGRIAFGFQLWGLVMLELWHREVVEGSPAPLAAP